MDTARHTDVLISYDFPFADEICVSPSTADLYFKFRRAYRHVCNQKINVPWNRCLAWIAQVDLIEYPDQSCAIIRRLLDNPLGE